MPLLMIIFGIKTRFCWYFKYFFKDIHVYNVTNNEEIWNDKKWNGVYILKEMFVRALLFC